MNKFKTPVVFYAAEGDPAAGAPPQLETPPSQPPAKLPDVEGMIQKAIDSVMKSQRVNGNQDEALIVFAAKALKEEKRAQDAESKIGKIPDEIQTELDTYKSFGSVEDLTARLEAAATLTTEKAQRELTDDFRKAAQVAGYDANALLEVIGTVPKSIIETVKKDGKDIEIAKVLSGDDDKTGKAFEDAMKEKFPTIHDSLLRSDGKTRNVPRMGVNEGEPNTDEQARKGQESLYSGSNF